MGRLRASCLILPSIIFRLPGVEFLSAHSVGVCNIGSLEEEQDDDECGDDNDDDDDKDPPVIQLRGNYTIPNPKYIHTLYTLCLPPVSIQYIAYLVSHKVSTSPSAGAVGL